MQSSSVYTEGMLTGIRNDREGVSSGIVAFPSLSGPEPVGHVYVRSGA